MLKLFINTFKLLNQYLFLCLIIFIQIVPLKLQQRTKVNISVYWTRHRVKKVVVFLLGYIGWSTYNAEKPLLFLSYGYDIYQIKKECSSNLVISTL